MLNPQNNFLDYGAMLKPPVGFILSKALALTYSLDLDTLVSIPIALQFSQSLDLNVGTSLLQLLNAITKTKDVLKVVFQNGQLTVKNTDHFLHNLLRDTVIPYTPNPNTSFHPKTWIIRYKNLNNDIKYRLIVLSRNMTFDESWDVAFTIDGDLTKKKNHTKEIKPLIDLIVHIQSKTSLKGYDDFIEDLLYINWDKQNDKFPITDFNIEVSGIPLAKGFDIFNIGALTYQRSLIISPFLTASLLEKIIKASSSKPILVSRKGEIDCKLSQNQLNKFNAYILKDEQIFMNDAEEEGNQQSQINSLQSDVHAKLYVMDENDGNTRIYLGSTNATYKGHNANVELMVRIYGKTKQMGVEVINTNLLKSNSYFIHYDTKEPLSKSETIIAEAEKALDQVKQQLIEATIKATYNTIELGKYDLVINTSSIIFSKDIQVTIRPIYLIEDAEKIFAKEVKFYLLEEQQLTPFIAIKIKHKKIIDADQRNFVLKVDTKGMPVDLDKIIFRKIISDSVNFMRYLRFLLTEDYCEGITELNSIAIRNLPGESGKYLFVDDQPIYEVLLKAYSSEFDKFDDIQMAIEKLKNNGENNDCIVLPAFYEMWQRIYSPKRKKR